MQYCNTVICFENNYKWLQLKKCTNYALELPLLFSGITSEKKTVLICVFPGVFGLDTCVCTGGNLRQAEAVKAV